MKKHLLETVVLVSFGVITVPVSLALSSQPVKLGSFEVEASLDTSIEHDSNVFTSQTNEQDSAVARLLPYVSLSHNTNQHNIDLTYTGETVRILDFSDDSYSANALAFEGLFSIAKYHKVGFKSSYLDGRELRGTASSEGNLSTIVDGATEYSQTDLALVHTYGGDNEGPFSTELEIGTSDIEYDNFRVITKPRDRDVSYANLSLDYKFSVATSVFLDLKHKDSDYQFASQSLGYEMDNTETTAHMGLAWSATKGTTGRVGVGVTSRDVEQVNSDSTFASWEAAVTWEPSSRDSVEFLTSKATDEPAGTGLYLINTLSSISWDHTLSRALTSSVFARIESIEFEDNNRDDDAVAFGLSAIYAVKPNLDVSFAYEYSEKDSNINSFDFEQNVFKLGVVVAL